MSLTDTNINKNFKVNDYAMVFDGNEWMKCGGDVGDNSQFWKKAKILKIYWYGAIIGTSDWVVDVMFPDGRISKAHFLSSINKCC